MKRITLIASLALFSMAAMSQSPPEKQFTIKLTESQLMAVLNLINDAPIPGADRRAFDKLIRDQAVAQIQRDTTAPKQPIPQPKDKPKN